MDTDSRNGKLTTDWKATIHPITTRRSDHGSTPAQFKDGDTDGRAPAATTPQRLVFTVDEAAVLLRISRGLAYELVARGELPSIRLGRRIVIPRVVLEELTGTAIA